MPVGTLCTKELAEWWIKCEPFDPVKGVWTISPTIQISIFPKTHLWNHEILSSEPPKRKCEWSGTGSGAKKPLVIILLEHVG